MGTGMDLSKYADLFLSEAREHVAELGGALSELEHTPSSADAIAAAFRAVHSIKGMAAAMGYVVVTERADTMESALEALRSGEEQATRTLLAHMLEESDVLAQDIELASAQMSASGGANSAAAGGEPPPRRAAPAHVRVRASRLDDLMNLVGEIEIERARMEMEVARVADDRLRETFGSASRLVSELREQVIAARMVPAGQVFERFPRLVRETARALGKEVDFTLDGAEIEMDRSILDRVGDPVMHLLRNALDHGMETPADRESAGKPARGRLTLSAQREAGYVLIRVADDGRGIDRERVLERARSRQLITDDVTSLEDAELLRVLVHPGFSTATSVTSVSGRGVGLDAVDAAVRALGGAIELRTIHGRGTAITMRLPLSVAIVRALVARVGDEHFAIPFTHVVETVALEPPVHAFRGQPWHTAEIGGSETNVVMLRARLGLPPRIAERMPGVCVRAGGRRSVLVVDGFVGQQDVVVKRFDPPRGGAPMFAGATVLGDGSPALIVDVNSLI